MARAFKILTFLAGTGLVLFLAGFFVFANSIMRYKPGNNVKADGIVVLTGGEYRILEAVNLLGQGKAKRLLISGVNRRTSRNELRRLTGHGDGLFDCCIDIGYQALNTVGNAEETRNWAERMAFKRLIIVTSNYHMPRSLVELGRVMPNVKLQAFPVVPRKFKIASWWRHPGTTRLLLSEYIKFLPSVARAGAMRLLRPLNTRTLNAVAASSSANPFNRQ